MRTLVAPPRSRGILFSAPMVRAILAGRKTQTRRVVTTEIPPGVHELFAWFGKGVPPGADMAPVGLWTRTNGCPNFLAKCPYGAPGDRLWVRETWAPCDTMPQTDPPEFVRYKADDSCWTPEGPVEQHGHDEPPARWKPGIHLPRVCARLVLELCDVRVERLQEITADDVFDEGFGCWDDGARLERESIEDFAAGWTEINGPRGYGWDVNPRVWVLTFRRIP